MPVAFFSEHALARLRERTNLSHSDAVALLSDDRSVIVVGDQSQHGTHRLIFSPADGAFFIVVTDRKNSVITVLPKQAAELSAVKKQDMRLAKFLALAPADVRMACRHIFWNFNATVLATKNRDSPRIFRIPLPQFSAEQYGWDYRRLITATEFLQALGEALAERGHADGVIIRHGKKKGVYEIKTTCPLIVEHSRRIADGLSENGGGGSAHHARVTLKQPKHDGTKPMIRIFARLRNSDGACREMLVTTMDGTSMHDGGLTEHAKHLVMRELMSCTVMIGGDTVASLYMVNSDGDTADISL